MIIQLDHLPQPVKTGSLPPKHDHRTLRMGSYLSSKLPPAGPFDWTRNRAQAGMMLNDQLGDCTCAALGHIIQAWTAANGKEVTVPDAAILQAYRDFCGYDGTPATDQGGIEIDVLNGFRTKGVAGFKADAFVELQPQNREHVLQAGNLFGPPYIGLALPVTIQSQGYSWFVDPTAGAAARPGSLGGHAVIVEKADADWVWFRSWGELYRATWAWWLAYTVESYAVLSKAWAPAGSSPSGFDWATLQADLRAVTG